MTTHVASEHGTGTLRAQVDGLREMLPDYVVFDAPGGIRWKGKATCRKFYEGWLAAFPDAQVALHGLHIFGDVAVEEGIFTGTHNGVLRGPTGDIPPTGRPVRIGYVQVLRLRDSAHGSFSVMFDRRAMLEQLGLAPAGGPLSESPNKEHMMAGGVQSG